LTHRRTALSWSLGILCAASLAVAQNGDPGHVNFLEYTGSNFNAFTNSPATSIQQFLQSHLAGLVTYSPYFDSQTSWFPNAYFYQDLYSIPVGSAIQYSHPEWILRGPSGNWLYIPYACGGGACSQWAGDIANPAFRAWWISQAASHLAAGHYAGIFIDDVNMEFRVSDGAGNQEAPVDSNTGQVMSYDAWRSYIAGFTEQIRAAFPSAKLIENAIWFADSGAGTADPSIRSQIATANVINLERGVASDGGLTGGTGQWSVYALLNYVDQVHADGAAVNFLEGALSTAGQQYGLAAYLLTSSGYDSLGDATSTPYNWWSGYNVDLGGAYGPRTYHNGVFQRNFQNGVVLLGEPGLAARTINLNGWYTTIDGTWVNSVTISGSQGIVLIGNPGGPAL